MSAPEQPQTEWTWFKPYLGREKGPLALGIFLVCLTNGLQLSIPYLSKKAVDALLATGLHRAQVLAYAIAAVALTQAVIRVFSRIYLLDAGRQVEFKLRGDLFTHLARLTPSFYARVGVGDVMSRMVNDLGQLRLLIGPGLLMLVNAVAAYVVALPAMLRLDPLLTACALLPYLPLLVLLQAQAKRVFLSMRRVQDELGALSARIQENLAGQLSVKSFGREASEEAAFEVSNQAYCEANVKLAQTRAAMMVLFGGLNGLGAVAVLGIGGAGLLRGTLTLGGYTAFAGYLAELSARASMLGFFLAGWQRGRASLSRVRELLTETPAYGDSRPDGHQTLQGKVELRGLSIAYGPRTVLDGVSLVVEPGRTLAVVGQTGAGKSTLLLALARLVDVPPGTVLYDGVDLRDWPLHDLRRQLGWVPQEPFLFSATLGANIAFGRPDAPLAQIAAAADGARLAQDLKALPEGLATEVGERGVTLSGGQRSRAALARALLVDPKVLLLDDPFANVDADTARALWEELARRSAKATRILVTHRLSLAMACDEIAVLEAGKLVERGRHAELLVKGGAYAKLFAREQLQEELKEQLKEAG